MWLGGSEAALWRKKELVRSKIYEQDSQHQLLRFSPQGHEAGTRYEDQAQVLQDLAAEPAMPGSGPSLA